MQVILLKRHYQTRFSFIYFRALFQGGDTCMCFKSHTTGVTSAACSVTCSGGGANCGGDFDYQLFLSSGMLMSIATNANFFI